MVTSSSLARTPSPTDNAPCGSKSTSSTRRPTSARAAPRLMVVVVLPTPPFWLHMAMMRAGPWLVRAAGSGKSGMARPVGPSRPGPTASVPGRRAWSRSVLLADDSGVPWADGCDCVVTSGSTGVSLPVSWRSTVSLALIGTTLSAGTGVALGIDLAEPLHRDQRVDLGRGDRRVAEQLLHHADVRAAVQQVGSERVPQGVRRHVAGEVGTFGCRLEDRPGRLPRQAPAALVEEDGWGAPPLRREGGAPTDQVGADRLGGIGAEGDDPFLAALA